uniref:Uncharacterized protein n=1 Tax=Noctiluca scintillans TaxID=2966 RepID=A0A7S0ZVV3_NOCSC
MEPPVEDFKTLLSVVEQLSQNLKYLFVRVSRCEERLDGHFAQSRNMEETFRKLSLRSSQFDEHLQDLTPTSRQHANKESFISGMRKAREVLRSPALGTSSSADVDLDFLATTATLKRAVDGSKTVERTTPRQYPLDGDSTPWMINPSLVPSTKAAIDIVETAEPDSWGGIFSWASQASFPLKKLSSDASRRDATLHDGSTDLRASTDVDSRASFGSD